jgi:hypothetical protein
MNAFQIFFGEFWPTFVGSSIGLSLAWVAKHDYLPFIGPSTFTELAVFTKDEQKRLLHEASKEALAQWHSFIPTLVFLVIFPFGSALAHTLPKITTLPDSFWIHVVFGGLFGALGCWLAIRLGVLYVRPFLIRCIERTRHAI